VTAPLSAVLAAVDDGVTTRTAIADRTGLDPDVVDAAVDHLLRLGRVSSLSLKTACPDGGCHGCGSPTGAGCGAGPVPVSIGRPPR
jgi:hypothetical protein